MTLGGTTPGEKGRLARWSEMTWRRGRPQGSTLRRFARGEAETGEFLERVASG
jgi:hypothetical protein